MVEQRERTGARVAFLSTKKALIEQTKYAEDKGRYVIAHREDGSKIERHVNLDDDKGIGDAVRAALNGTL